MKDMDIVDLGRLRARMTVHEQCSAKSQVPSNYEEPPERWYARDVTDGSSSEDDLRLRVAALERQVKRLEESIAWLERGQRSLGMRLYKLETTVFGPDRNDESEPQPEPVRF